MTEPLFIQPDVTFEKLSAEVDLSEDPNQWPHEVLQELYKQVPYIADFEPSVEMQKVDSERGYGIGQVILSIQSEAQQGTDPEMLEATGVRSVRIPLVIKERKLSPFDLLVNDTAKVLPLTENRLRTALFRPQMFDVTSQTPGDQSMIGQLYPPYRQNNGFGGGGMMMGAGMGKQSSAGGLEEFLLEDEKTAGLARGRRLLERLGKDTAKGVDAPTSVRDALRREIRKTSDRAFKVGMRGEDYLKSRGYKHHSAAVDAAKKKHLARLEKTSSVLEEELIADLESKDAGFRQIVPFKKTSSLLRATFHSYNESDIDGFFNKLSSDDGLQAAYSGNREAIIGPLSVLAGNSPLTLEKRASALEGAIASTVTQLTKTASGYQVKTANHAFWRPEVRELSRRDVVQTYGEKVALAADEAGQVTMMQGEGAAEPNTLDIPQPEPIEAPGVYKVTVDDEGKKELIGAAIPNLIDSDGTPLPLVLFTNGSHTAVQPDIVGISAGDTASLPTAFPGGAGAFFSQGKDGKLMATIPMELSASYSMPGEPSTFKGETFDGREVEVSIQPNIQTVMGTPEGKMLIPTDWQWTPLGSSESVGLVGHDSGNESAPEDWHEGSDREDPGLEEEPEEAKESHVVVRGDHDCFTLTGPAVEKLAHEETHNISLDQAMFLLAGLGVEQGYGVTKLAHSLNGPEHVRTGRRITTADEQEKWAAARAQEYVSMVPRLKRDLTKEAAVIPDPTAVDTVLSLGFINPENVMTYVSYLPTVEDAQAKMCELLLASRVGLSDIPSSALERAVRSTEEVIEGLKILAFQGN